MAYFLIVLNVFIITAGQLFFKRSADFMNENTSLVFPMNYLANPWFYAAVTLFVLSTFVWTQALTKVPLSFAYPLVSSAYILTVLGAFFIFNERITPMAIVGVLLIMLGITLTALK